MSAPREDSTGHMPWCTDQHGGRCGPPPGVSEELELLFGGMWQDISDDVARSRRARHARWPLVVDPPLQVAGFDPGKASSAREDEIEQHNRLTREECAALLERQRARAAMLGRGHDWSMPHRTLEPGDDDTAGCPPNCPAGPVRGPARRDHITESEASRGAAESGVNGGVRGGAVPGTVGAAAGGDRPGGDVGGGDGLGDGRVEAVQPVAGAPAGDGGPGLAGPAERWRWECPCGCRTSITVCGFGSPGRHVPRQDRG